MPTIGNDWDQLIGREFEKDYYLALRAFLIEEYRHNTIYPNKYDIFNAIKLTSYRDIKVVILGQDPYIKPAEAHGLSFSVKAGVRVPPSLMNVYKELHNDLGCQIPDNGFLEKWAKQGVLLLNTVLTVREKQSNSHKNKGWEIFTNKIIETIDNRDVPVVFMLWGSNAKEKEALIQNPKHLILKAAHPSPLAGGAFFGCKHFSKANEFLAKNNLSQIDWQIDNINSR